MAGGTRTPSSRSEGAVAERERFARRLRELKRSGSAIFVTGKVQQDASAHHMRRALGGPGNKQILASTHPRPGTLLPEAVSPHDPTVTVVSRTEHQRSAAAQTGAPAEFDDDLAGLREEITDAVAAFDRRNDLQASELRASVDSVGRLLDEAGEPAVERFLRDVSRAVTGTNGTCYYHLRRADDSAVVRELSSLADARIELRQTVGGAQQRWHLPDEALTTDWVPL